jgi:hypothetical protein
MKPIAIFYHGLFFRDNEWLPHAFTIAQQQFWAVEDSGLEKAASEIHIGLNGGQESLEPARLVFPAKAEITLHGQDSKNECSTILMLEDWVKTHPDWYVLYFHCKGATHPPGHGISDRWRGCMMRNNVLLWHRCVADLMTGCDAVGCHWMEPPETPEGQYIFAGTFFWAKSNFMRELPSIMDRPQIKKTGLKHLDSRYEAEVWLGNGPRRPVIKDYHGPLWNPGKWGTCEP